jgi:hypothetical protein
VQGCNYVGCCWACEAHLSSESAIDAPHTTAIKENLIMSTLSVRLPDNIASRLKSLAHSRNISLNKLMNELSTRILAKEETK